MDAAVSMLLEAAKTVYEQHAPGPDGACPVPGCLAGVDGGPGCWPWTGAWAVLAVWGDQDGNMPSSLGTARNALRHLRPGEAVRVPAPVAQAEAVREFVRHIGRTPIGPVGEAHPPWCDGPPVCSVSDGFAHVGGLIQVGYATAMLTGDGSGPVMIGVAEPRGEISVPASHGEVLGQVLRDLCQTAATAV